ncbi:MAG: GerMN domain-containing protein [Clostridia bacterium]|nr:GerMN domain-containing protein [Clostridia bacterium]
MKKKIGIVIILMSIVILGFVVYKNISIETEYTPELEIEDTEYRNTAISLYFQDKESKTLQVETKLIDSKELLKNPYIKLISLLLEGPDNQNFESPIPSGTRLISVVQDGDVLVVDLSSEFLNFETPEAKSNSIYSIVNTVTELNEISKVKFLIDSNEIDDLNNEFAREK